MKSRNFAHKQAPVHVAFQIQHVPGNQSKRTLLDVHSVQTKLKVSHPNEPAEEGADRVAEQVMRMPAPVTAQAPETVARRCKSCEEEEKIRRKTDVQNAGTPEVASVTNMLGGGSQLDTTTKEFMESRFGHDFGEVRVHSGTTATESAGEMNALAYTVGRDIVFAEGKYAPHTTEGRKLLAHELAHVIQQETAQPMVQRAIDNITMSGCDVTIQTQIGIYGSRSSLGLATKWQNWINTRWSNEVRCSDGKSKCPIKMSTTLTAYPTKNWWWEVPEDNYIFVEELDYRSYTNQLTDGGSWAENEDELSIAHETGHLMGEPDYYWRLPLMGDKSMSGYENDIMANYYQDPGPTEFHHALARILTRHNKACPCCAAAPKQPKPGGKETIGHNF